MLLADTLSDQIGNMSAFNKGIQIIVKVGHRFHVVRSAVDEGDRMVLTLGRELQGEERREVVDDG